MVRPPRRRCRGRPAPRRRAARSPEAAAPVLECHPRTVTATLRAGTASRAGALTVAGRTPEAVWRGPAGTALAAVAATTRAATTRGARARQVTPTRAACLTPDPALDSSARRTPRTTTHRTVELTA